MRRSIALLLPLLASQVRAGDRVLTIKSECAESLWPAIANYVVDGATLYSGIRGWEQMPGESKDITVPGDTNLRVWARKICTANGEKLSCKVGTSYSSPLEPKDNDQGDTSLFELNMKTTDGMDYWDISNVPGWGTTISVFPTDTSCMSAECTKDLNPNCPAELSIQHEGETVGCLSACMAKINAETPSHNCCSGIYEQRELCDKGQVDFYSYFKDGCTHAYAYPFDDGVDDPPVVFACPQVKESGYVVTFCPGGSGTALSNNGDEDEDEGTTTAMLGLATETETDTDAGKTGTENTETATKDGDSPSGAPSGAPSAFSSHASAAASASAMTGATAAETGGATKEAATTAPAGASKTSSPAAGTAAGSSAGSTTSEEDGLFGLSNLAVGAIGGGIMLVLIAGVVVCICMRRKAGAAGGQRAQAGYAESSSQTQAAQANNAASLAHRRSRSVRSRRAAIPAYEQSSSEASSGGEGEMNSSDEERELMRERRSRAGSVSRRV